MKSRPVTVSIEAVEVTAEIAWLDGHPYEVGLPTPRSQFAVIARNSDGDAQILAVMLDLKSAEEALAELGSGSIALQ